MKKKKICTLLLVLAMTAQTLCGCSNAVSVLYEVGSARIAEKEAKEAALAEKEAEEKALLEEAESEKSRFDTLVEELSLPAVGDVVEGFEVKSLTDFPTRDAVIVQMEHLKTGAELFFVANEDEDKAILMGYKTRMHNDKGIPHVFEHITLSGSGKYPNSTLWDRVSGGTYNTYMNASTYSCMTCYDISSLSDEQLLAITDFYMSGLTDPLALRDEHPLGREAYRYQLYDANEDINVTGAVYNEMEGSNSKISYSFFDGLYDTLYPGSFDCYSSGGMRDDIITITLDELKDFYELYYHPSNMIIGLYGNADYAKYLKLLNEDYLSKYDRKEIDTTDYEYEPMKAIKRRYVIRQQKKALQLKMKA